MPDARQWPQVRYDSKHYLRSEGDGYSKVRVTGRNPLANEWLDRAVILSARYYLRAEAEHIISRAYR